MIETKQYDLVLGHLEDDGCRIPGLLDSLDCAQVRIYLLLIFTSF